MVWCWLRAHGPPSSVRAPRLHRAIGGGKNTRHLFNITIVPSFASAMKSPMGDGFLTYLLLGVFSTLIVSAARSIAERGDEGGVVSKLLPWADTLYSDLLRTRRGSVSSPSWGSLFFHSIAVVMDPLHFFNVMSRQFRALGRPEVTCFKARVTIKLDSLI